MPKIDESDLDVGNEPPFVARKIVIKTGQNPRNDYSFSDELGRGRFGRVLKCTEKKTGLKLAAKFVSTRAKEEKENVQREVEIMKSLQHRRLLQLYDVYDNGQEEMCIITELISGGELFERVIDDDFELTEKVCAIFMRQICEGVDYMHQKFIMHLDMKPENILCVTRTGNRIKLIDFGLAREFDPKKTLQVMFGTPDFAAPEVLSYDRVTPAADMWSVGVICYVLLSGLSPFMGNSDLETMTNVTKAIYDFDDDSFDPITAEAKDFISKLLIKDPQRRLKPSECLKHKWLAKLAVKEQPGKVTKLNKTKLKKYVVRRRWQKAANAIMALRRMGANLSLTGTGPSTVGSKSPRSTTTTTKTTIGPQTKVSQASKTSSNVSSSSSYSSSSNYPTKSQQTTPKPVATAISSSRYTTTTSRTSASTPSSTRSSTLTSSPSIPRAASTAARSSYQTSSYSTSSTSSSYRTTSRRP